MFSVNLFSFMMWCLFLKEQFRITSSGDQLENRQRSFQCLRIKLYSYLHFELLYMSEYASLGFKSEVNIQGLYPLHQFRLLLFLFCPNSRFFL